ncbi:MAG TPA: hypothetical protein VFY01_04955 [Rheinheimera sp.]|nr:hypothetical protein [Rheinheimera sp.]
MTLHVNAKQVAQIVFSEKTVLGDKVPCAYIDLRNPTECILEQDKTGTWLTLAVDARVMDQLALAWCKQRNLTVADKIPAA